MNVITVTIVFDRQKQDPTGVIQFWCHEFKDKMDILDIRLESEYFLDNKSMIELRGTYKERS